MTKEAKGNPFWRALPLLGAFIGTLLLCWPAILNGGAFFFPDTSAYLRGADAVAHEAIGTQSPWSDKRELYERMGPTPISNPRRLNHDKADPTGSLGEPRHPVLLNRSVYYGLSILPFVLVVSIGGALLQSALVVFGLRIVLAAMSIRRDQLSFWLLGSVVLLASFTSLPFYVSLLMPDVFAGLVIALAVSAAVGWDRLFHWERAGMVALMMFGAMAHSSHILLLLSIFVIALLMYQFTEGIARAGLAVILLAALSGVASENIFASMIAHRLGSAPVRPPFLTARLVDEGAGFRMLKARCPGIGLEACRFVDRMPRDSDTFLWSPNPEGGVFSVESLDVQRRLAQQDSKFALATLEYDPTAVVLQSAKAAVEELFRTDLNIFNAPAPVGDAQRLYDNLPRRFAQEVHESLYAAGQMPVVWSESANALAAIAGAAYLVWILIDAVVWRRPFSRAEFAAALFLAGVLANAAITGALSKPHDRYNARVIWVLPLASLTIMITGASRQRRGKRDATS